MLRYYQGSDVQRGVGGYERVALPELGEVWAQAFVHGPEARDLLGEKVGVRVLGWGEQPPIRWQSVPLELRPTLANTVDPGVARAAGLDSETLARPGSILHYRIQLAVMLADEPRVTNRTDREILSVCLVRYADGLSGALWTTAASRQEAGALADRARALSDKIRRELA